MGDTAVGRYWCHACSRAVNPVMEVEIKCPLCESGFLEEMESWRGDNQDAEESESDRALSLWAPILLGMMGPSRRRRRFRRRLEEGDVEEEEEEERRQEEEEEAQPNAVGGGGGGRESVESLRRRRRDGLAILQLLQSLREGMASESENPDANDLDRLILINPFNQAIVLQGSLDSNQSENETRHSGANRIGPSLGDYFLGPGLDLLLQHLAENDPSRQGTPPAKKEAVEAMPTVKVCDDLRCSICLEDFQMDSEAREMPCKHKFHSDCIVPWLDIHSSCPICRYQMPVDESKDSSATGRNERGNGEAPENGEGGADRRGEQVLEAETGRRFWMPIRWRFNGWFSQNENSSSNGNASHSDEN